MTCSFPMRQTVISALTLISATSMLLSVPTQAAEKAATKKTGTYVSGDFHNHTTCSDGSLSIQKLVDKATSNKTGAFNLDWFVQTDHGGNSPRNCTISEDPFEPNTPALGLSTTSNSGTSPATTLSATSVNPYPVGGQSGTLAKGPNQLWSATLAGGVNDIKGDVLTASQGGYSGRTMYRWQEIKEYQYKVLETESRNRKKPIWIGNELNAPGHEHVQTTILDGQATWPSTATTGNATLMAQHEYCFDRNDADTSRGAENQWDCSVKDSTNQYLDATAKKIKFSNSDATPNVGHYKSVDAVKWLKEKALNTSFYIPAHIERAGFYQDTFNRGTDIEHFREYNNIAPTIAYGVEFMPGHQPSGNRGEFSPTWNGAAGTLNAAAAAGGRTYGGTGGYAASIGGVWDALLGEGRNFWFFASSDYHNRGIFGPDQRESTQDFLPGEYTKMYVMARNGADSLSPQIIMDGLRSGNVFVANGSLIDQLSFVVCRYNPTVPRAAFQALIEKAALTAASAGKEVRINGCATMGEKLVARADTDLLVTAVMRNPKANNSPYTFPNPSLAQINVTQPLNAPVLDHVDVIWGQVTSKPLATNAVVSPCVKSAYFSCGDLESAAAKNASTIMAKRFNSTNWKDSGNGFLTMSYKVTAGKNSQYFRLRGTNLPVSTPNETDANGNPLADDTSNVNKIACTHASCPAHLNNAGGVKYSSYDVAAWSDLWFYSNPVFVEVIGNVTVAGAK